MPTCPIEIEKVVGARTAMSSSVAEKAQTCSRKKQRSGLKDVMSSGTDKGIFPAYKKFDNGAYSGVAEVSKLSVDAIELLL